MTTVDGQSPRCRRDPRAGARRRADHRRGRASPCSSRATSSRSAASRTSCATASTTRRGSRFIVDRNINYTNVCVTDCDFCAFYRSPGDTREGYLLPKPVIFKKIEETLAIGGTGVLMQGGHHPDLGIDYYEDLFTLDQGALPDPPARALAARGAAHRAPLEADDPGDALAPARRRPRLAPRRRRRDPRRPRARRSSRRRRRRPTSGST